MSALAAFFRDITLGQARAVLFGAWLLGACTVCLFFAFLSLEQYRTGGASAGWEWLAPTIGPTLALISASAVINALERTPAEDRKLTRPGVFYAILAWSAAYFAALAGAIAISAQWGGAFINAATLLATMQMVLAVLLGVFLAPKQT